MKIRGIEVKGPNLGGWLLIAILAYYLFEHFNK